MCLRAMESIVYMFFELPRGRKFTGQQYMQLSIYVS